MTPTVNLDIEKLAVNLPGMPQPISLLDVTTKTALLAFILYAPFFAKPRPTNPHFEADGEIDYDAPLERRMKVGHIVRRQEYTLGFGDAGTIRLPRFLQQAFDLYEPEHKFQLPDNDEHYFTLIHDECYLGKDVTAHECVDFDPPHKAPIVGGKPKGWLSSK